jgi:hypothetical protein
MFEHSDRDGRITIREAFNGFYITLNATEETKGMGDGVDWFMADGTRIEDAPSDFENYVDVGTPEFYKLLTEDIDDCAEFYISAYFGGQDEEAEDATD